MFLAMHAEEYYNNDIVLFPLMIAQVSPTQSVGKGLAWQTKKVELLSPYMQQRVG